MMRRWPVRAAACLLAAAGSSIPAPAQAAPQVTIIVGFAPGGGDGEGGRARAQGVLAMRPQPRYNLAARLYARHLPRFLPGQPSIVVRHMPGAGSIRAAQWLLAEAPSDGRHVAVLSGFALRALAARNNAPAISRLTPIGALETGSYFCAARTARQGADAPAFGATAPGERTHLHARAFAAAAGRNLRIVSGYANTSQIALAFRRQEIDGFCGFSLSLLRSQLGDAMEAGALRPLARFAPPGPDGAAIAPRVSGLPAAGARPAGLASALSLLEWQGLIDWTLMGPPDMDLPAAQAWRTAYETMVRDNAFRSDAARWGLDVEPASARAVSQAMRRIEKLAPAASGTIAEWSGP